MRVIKMALLLTAVLLVVSTMTPPTRAQFFKIDDDPIGGGGCSNYGPFEVEIRATQPIITYEGSVGGEFFEVRLRSNPGTFAQLIVKTDDATEGKIWAWQDFLSMETQDIFFDSSNWNDFQTIFVVGEADCLNDGDVPYTFSVENPDYPGCPLGVVNAINRDISTMCHPLP